MPACGQPRQLVRGRTRRFFLRRLRSRPASASRNRFAAGGVYEDAATGAAAALANRRNLLAAGSSALTAGVLVSGVSGLLCRPARKASHRPRVAQLCQACGPDAKVVAYLIYKSVAGGKMELSFICDNSADASSLAQELELFLRQDGVPAKALSLRQSSAEHMDIGSVLWISVETAAQILGPIASIASFAKCVHEIAGKYHRGVVIKDQDRVVTIPASEIDKARIEAALTKPV
jgi:hypothetical protein